MLSRHANVAQGAYQWLVEACLWTDWHHLGTQGGPSFSPEEATVRLPCEVFEGTPEEWHRAVEHVTSPPFQVLV